MRKIRGIHVSADQPSSNIHRTNIIRAVKSTDWTFTGPIFRTGPDKEEIPVPPGHSEADGQDVLLERFQRKLKRVRMIQSSFMRSAGVVCIILFCSILVAGCNQLPQLPGIHILTNTPDPIIGQWIGGEPPASDRHVIFYENQTFLSTTFFIRRGEETTTGNWTKIQPGLYSTRSVSGEITQWGYDSFDDSIYISGLPQMKYHRYKG